VRACVIRAPAADLRGRRGGCGGWRSGLAGDAPRALAATARARAGTAAPQAHVPPRRAGMHFATSLSTRQRSAAPVCAPGSRGPRPSPPRAPRGGRGPRPHRGTQIGQRQRTRRSPPGPARPPAGARPSGQQRRRPGPRARAPCAARRAPRPRAPPPRRPPAMEEEHTFLLCRRAGGAGGAAARRRPRRRRAPPLASMQAGGGAPGSWLPGAAAPGWRPLLRAGEQPPEPRDAPPAGPRPPPPPQPRVRAAVAPGFSDEPSTSTDESLPPEVSRFISTAPGVQWLADVLRGGAAVGAAAGSGGPLRLLRQGDRAAGARAPRGRAAEAAQRAPLTRPPSQPRLVPAPQSGPTRCWRTRASGCRACRGGWWRRTSSGSARCSAPPSTSTNSFWGSTGSWSSRSWVS
jgi:hypothetical protein